MVAQSDLAKKIMTDFDLFSIIPSSVMYNVAGVRGVI